ncbi:MAG: dihydrofolate reductase [Puniceicoccales bacterium]|nr:dihydrofolate reductase [Puniceicoccales bacterium]
MDPNEKLCRALLENLDMRAIAAMAENRIIGSGNSMPWKIPEELSFFHRTTQNASVLMGRKTFESIGHPLHNRRNIVVTRDPSWSHAGVTAIGNFYQLLELGIGDTLWVCGGGSIYDALLPACGELYLSIVCGKFEGDAKFPEFDHLFTLDKTILTCPRFRVEHYRRRT